MKQVCVTPVGKGWKVVSGFFQTLLHVPFPFAGFALHSFTVVSHSHEYNYVLSSLSPLSESSNLGVMLGTPDTVVDQVHLQLECTMLI
jgi:hypothetical protein